jgi:hypothetical protein
MYRSKYEVKHIKEFLNYYHRPHTVIEYNLVLLSLLYLHGGMPILL